MNDWVLVVLFIIGVGVILYGLFSQNPFGFLSSKDKEENEPDPNLN